MLHAAPIGLPSAGKSTLFQLVTSAKEGGRSVRGGTAAGRPKGRDARAMADGCRARVIPHGTPARLAAGESHGVTRGFIRAEVVGYDALVTYGPLAACTEAGVVRPEGGGDVVPGSDIIGFVRVT